MSSVQLSLWCVDDSSTNAVSLSTSIGEQSEGDECDFLSSQKSLNEGIAPADDGNVWKSRVCVRCNYNNNRSPRKACDRCKMRDCDAQSSLVDCPTNLRPPSASEP